MKKKVPAAFSRLLFLALVCLAGFIAVLVSLSGLYTPAQAKSEAQENARIVLEIRTTASRGEIYDRNGIKLVSNEPHFTLMLSQFGFDADKRVQILLRALKLLEAHGVPYCDAMPVSSPPFSYTFEEGSAQEARFARFLSYRGLDPDLDAFEAMRALCVSYLVPASCTPEEARAVMGVFYDLYQSDFSASNPYLFVKDADGGLLAEVCEDPLLRTCLTCGVRYERRYETDALSHVLGRVGAIPAEQIGAYRARGYAYSARVGLDGAEAAFEELLRGTDGVETAACLADGTVERILSGERAVSGKNIRLTIDLPLQIAAENALKTHIEALSREDDAVGGGAAVALDVRTGEVLAFASYPDYDLADFSAQYAELLEDARKPLVNRALCGLYAPGSTFKMCTATAALSDGIITPDTVIECTGIYDHYAPDYLYRCWIYSERGQTHGLLRVDEALSASCNVFFYETGRLCGIERIARFARLFGLGEKTGIELPGEAAGVVAGPEVRQARGLGFYPGDTLQAAIGQSDTLCTPLQLACYVASVVNGGTRYVPHILLRTENAQTGAVLTQTQPETAASIPYTKENLDAILSGMRAVTSDGTAKRVFEDYPVAVLGKSGSAQVSTGKANAIFVLAAPADEPEIAVCVVLEHGGQGSNAALAARDILDAYFAGKEE